MNKPVKLNIQKITPSPSVARKTRKVKEISVNTTTKRIAKAKSVEVEPDEDLDTELDQHANVDITAYLPTNASKLDSQVYPRDIHIDHSYQRETNLARVNQIVKNFAPNAVGTVYLSMRDNGTLHIIDGAHRVLALRKLGLDDYPINAQVFFGLTPKEEAELFVIMNQARVKPRPHELHKASVTAQDPLAVEIDNIITSLGLYLVDSPADNHVRAVRTVYTLYGKMNKRSFINLFRVLKSANGPSCDSFCVEYLVAVAIILIKYPTIDVERLTHIISKMGHPKVVISNITASAGRKITALQLQLAVASMIVDGYNSRLRSGKLDKTYVITSTYKTYLNPAV